MGALGEAGMAGVSFVACQARASGLGVMELVTLARAAQGDGVAPGVIGRSSGLRSSTMTMLSDRLEQKGLVARVAHPSDGRLVLLRATARGRRLLARVQEPLVASLAELVGSATADERDFLTGFVEQLTALLAGSESPAARPGRARGRSSTAACG